MFSCKLQFESTRVRSCVRMGCMTLISKEIAEIWPGLEPMISQSQHSSSYSTYRVRTSWECRNSMAFPELFPGQKNNFKGHQTTLGPCKGEIFFLQEPKNYKKILKKIMKSKVTNFPGLFHGKCSNSRVFQCLNFYFQIPGFSRIFKDCTNPDNTTLLKILKSQNLRNFPFFIKFKKTEICTNL